MKLKELISELRTSCKIILRFCRQHNDTLSIIQGTYLKQPLHGKPAVGLDTILTIKSCGSLYQVTLTDYINDEPAQVQTWLATYGWYSNGQLLKIGGEHCCLFDTVTKSLYLENSTESGKTTLELFTKNV